MTDVKELVDKIMLYFTGEDFAEEVNIAKAEYAEIAGAFDKSNDDFEHRMSLFADWYLFIRPNSDSKVTPVEMLGITDSLNLSSDEMESVKSLQESRHGLFAFLKVKKDDVYVKDLFRKDKIILKQSQVNSGFNKDEIFEARIIPSGDSWVFGSSFCFHPPQATRFILKSVKLVNKEKDEGLRNQARQALVLKLLKMKYKLQQYRHVEVKDIYSADPKLKL